MRIFQIIPDFEKQICQVNCLIEEWNDWKEMGQDDDFTNTPLDESRLPKLSEETENDLYYVWDESAKNYPERASRLYETFQKDIISFQKQLISS